MKICKHLLEGNLCQTAYEGTDPESGIFCNGYTKNCEFYEAKNVDTFLSKITFGNNSCYEAGKNGVAKITYNSAQGEGDRHYCDVNFLDGSEMRIFNITTIFWKRV